MSRILRNHWCISQLIGNKQDKAGDREVPFLEGSACVLQPVAHCSSTCLLTQLTIERVASAIAESVQNRVLDSPSAAEAAVEDAHEESSALCMPCACAHRQACTRARRDVVGDKVTKPNHQATRSLVHFLKCPFRGEHSCGGLSQITPLGRA